MLYPGRTAGPCSCNSIYNNYHKIKIVFLQINSEQVTGFKSALMDGRGRDRDRDSDRTSPSRTSAVLAINSATLQLLPDPFSIEIVACGGTLNTKWPLWAELGHLICGCVCVCQDVCMVCVCVSESGKTWFLIYMPELNLLGPSEPSD